jgi:HlyD family secretion protein
MFKKFLSLTVCAAVVFSLSACQSASNNTPNRYTGTVECESFYIQSEVAGKITEINLTQGQTVKEGEKYVQLDTASYLISKNAAQGVYKSAKAKLDDLPSSVSDNIKNEARGAVDSAQAQIDAVNLQINKCAILSSGSGIVTDVFLHKGEIAAQGMNIAKVSILSDEYVKIYVEESNRSSVKLNQQLKIYSNNSQLTTGKIVYIAPNSEFTPKNTQTKNEKEKTVFEIKIKLDGNNIAVPGLIVDVELS